MMGTNIKEQGDVKKNIPISYYERNELQYGNYAWGIFIQYGFWRFTWLKGVKFSIKLLSISGKINGKAVATKKHWTQYCPFFKKSEWNRLER